MKKETAMTAPATARFYVGDLCYVMKDAWDEVCNLTVFDNTKFEYELSDGRKYILFGTAYGDGTYNDRDGYPYSVDSGTIGAIKVDDIIDTEGLERTIQHGLGKIHEFPEEISEMDCYYQDGVIGIYNVEIDTAGDYDLDDEEDDEDEEDA
jgi:hypothetical protein